MRLAFATLLLALLAGCQHSDYVTRAELRDLLAAPGIDKDFALAPDRNEQLARLAAATFSAKPPATSSAAQAMAVVETYTADLSAAIGAADRCLSVCAQNISNAETTAYKATRVARTADGTMSFRPNMEQGSLESTNRPLDLAVSGNGFFKVKLRDTSGSGYGYTRNGNFFVDNNAGLVLGLADGMRLEPAISIPPGVTDISISEGGSIEVLLPGQVTKTRIGQLQLSQFVNPEGLKPSGGALYLATAASGDSVDAAPGEAGNGTVLQGFLEASNVDLPREYLRVRFLQNWRSMMLRAIEAH